MYLPAKLDRPWGIPLQIEPDFRIFHPTICDFDETWYFRYKVTLGPEHDSDSLTSLRVIVYVLYRVKLSILYVADLSLAGSNS